MTALIVAGLVVCALLAGIGAVALWDWLDDSPRGGPPPSEPMP